MGKRKKDKRTNNDLQNITHKTKDRVTRTPLKTGGGLMFSGRVSSSCSTSGTRLNGESLQIISQISYIPTNKSRRPVVLEEIFSKISSN